MKSPKLTNPDCEIVTIRIINTPRAVVFKAWSDPEHLKNWWGPYGFTNTFHEFDFREGGKWDFTMHGPEKGNYINSCEFTAIEIPSLIAWKRYSQPLFRVVVTFEEINTDSTKVIFRQIFDTKKECNKIRPFVEDKNEENMDKLEKEISTYFF
ncbi:SRPBCC family protein [Pedobacter sp. MC2016-14]|uniref:SRPBCC family protein n=1 Tax=Pedobacter sp. MC2016-14 TaxID=2897327 RepID=UPI001E430C7A|nr:SRPBCC family protein [Pedobacter sp. MC2016-14]MCD0489796.1 SRPBCC family protein [Pedobacter sp. MC2016-14]